MGQCLRRFAASLKGEGKPSSEKKADREDGLRASGKAGQLAHIQMNESIIKDDSIMINHEEPVQVVEPFQVFNQNSLIAPGELGMKGAETFHLPFSTQDTYSYNLNLEKNFKPPKEEDASEGPRSSISKAQSQQMQLSQTAKEKAMNIKLPSTNVIKEEEGEAEDEIIKSTKNKKEELQSQNKEGRGLVSISKLPPLDTGKRKDMSLPVDEHVESEQFSKARGGEHLSFDAGSGKERNEVFLPNTIDGEESSLGGLQGKKYTNIFDDSAEKLTGNESQKSFVNKKGKTSYPGIESMNKVLTQTIYSEKNNGSSVVSESIKADLNQSIRNKYDPPGEMAGGIIQGLGLDSSIEMKASKVASMKSASGVGIFKKSSLKGSQYQHISSPIGPSALQGQKGSSYLQGSESDNKPESGKGSGNNLKDADGTEDLFIKDFSDEEAAGKALQHAQGKGAFSGLKKLNQAENGGIFKSLQRESILDEERVLQEEDESKRKILQKKVFEGEKKEKLFDALQRPAVFGDFE